MTIKLIHMQW